MENASKALIIAGAIILSILIIGLGMAVFNMASNPSQDAAKAIESQEAIAFNSKFTSYLGDNIKGSTVRQLYNTVIQHNTSNQSDDSLLVAIGGKKETADLQTALKEIKAGYTYNLTAAYDANTGHINDITIEVASGKK